MPRQIFRSVAARGLATLVPGLVLGVAIAGGLSTVMASLFYGISPLEPAVFGLVPLVLLILAGCAIYVPARRASKVDPITELRAE